MDTRRRGGGIGGGYVVSRSTVHRRLRESLVRLRGGKSKLSQPTPDEELCLDTTSLLLGRAGSHLRMGIVGLPNVGKSSLFNLMSNLQVPAENYPFCTIEPNSARVKVPDGRFDWLVDLYKPRSQVGPALEVTDIAGLVQGAAEGQGLGNKFLSHIYAVDGIFHVVRAFKDPQIDHVEGSVDPVRDLNIISSELRKKDVEIMTGKVADLAKKVERANVKELKEDLDCARVVLQGLEKGKDVRYLPLTPKQCEITRSFSLLTAKPVIFLVNVGQEDIVKGKNKHFLKIKQWVEECAPQSKIIPVSVRYETELLEGKSENTTRPSMLPKIIKEGYTGLKLIHFFTTGSDEVKCWTIRNGTNAQRAAGSIHTDMEKGFIAAETMGYGDFRRVGSEGDMVKAGLKHTNGKTYVVRDGDIIFFKFSAPKTSAKKK
ncbi:hypothetical protein AAMO2058_001144800 [Amorphochlora amoebiformis]